MSKKPKDDSAEKKYIKSLSEVEMHPSFSYICDKCGEENSVIVMFREMGETTQILVPTLVTCKCCEKQYRGVPRGVAFLN